MLSFRERLIMLWDHFRNAVVDSWGTVKLFYTDRCLMCECE